MHTNYQTPKFSGHSAWYYSLYMRVNYTRCPYTHSSNQQICQIRQLASTRFPPNLSIPVNSPSGIVLRTHSKPCGRVSPSVASVHLAQSRASTAQSDCCAVLQLPRFIIFLFVAELGNYAWFMWTSLVILTRKILQKRYQSSYESPCIGMYC